MGGSKVEITDEALVDALYCVPEKLTKARFAVVEKALEKLNKDKSLTAAMRTQLMGFYKDLKLDGADYKARPLTDEERQAANNLPLLDYQKMPRPLKPPGVRS